MDENIDLKCENSYNINVRMMRNQYVTPSRKTEQFEENPKKMVVSGIGTQDLPNAHQQAFHLQCQDRSQGMWRMRYKRQSNAEKLQTGGDAMTKDVGAHVT